MFAVMFSNSDDVDCTPLFRLFEHYNGNDDMLNNVATLFAFFFKWEII